jgi:hypothetical protein
MRHPASAFPGKPILWNAVNPDKISGFSKPSCSPFGPTPALPPANRTPQGGDKNTLPSRGVRL